MFNITKNKLWFTLIPVLIIVAGIIGFFVNGGFRQDIDFAGGTSIELGMGKALTSAERAEAAKLYKDAAGLEVEPTVQLTGTASKNIVIKSTVLEPEARDAGIKAIADKFGMDVASETFVLSNATQAATYGNEMKTRTLLFTLLASILMLVYIWIRFELKSGVMAVLCLISNVLVMLSVYAIAKIPFPGRNIMFKTIVYSLMFNSTVTGITNFLLMSWLGMIDTYWAVIVPACCTTFGLYLMKQFMETSVTDAVLESARIDGAGEFRIFWKIAMPMVKPAWITLIIFAFKDLWNSGASTYIYSEELKTFNYAISQLVTSGVARTGVSAASTVVMMIVPCAVFYITQSNVIQTMSTSGMKD